MSDEVRSVLITAAFLVVTLFFGWLTYQPLEINGRDCFTIFAAVHCL